MSRDVRWLLWVDAELAAGIDAAAARTREDRSAWIRRKLTEAVNRGERPAFEPLEPRTPARPLELSDGLRW